MESLGAGVRRVASRLGLHVGSRTRFTLVRRHFYSPVPDVERLPPNVFDRVTSMPGVELDTARQIEWAGQELAEFVAEFEPPAGFRWDNSFYETGDAEIAYAMVRRLKPRRVIELGSGYSTLVLAHALARNRAEGVPATFRNFDPYPSWLFRQLSPAELDEQRRLPAEDVPLEVFASLEEGDVLFVDTSHTVKLGGDVNAIVLEILPRLARGVWIHFHDIWLPHEYHRVLVEEMGMYWNEQYLLQAFLAGNDGIEVVFATHAVAQAEDERFRALVPRYRGENYPTGFWMRRKP